MWKATCRIRTRFWLILEEAITCRRFVLGLWVHSVRRDCSKIHTLNQHVSILRATWYSRTPCQPINNLHPQLATIHTAQTLSRWGFWPTKSLHLHPVHCRTRSSQTLSLKVFFASTAFYCNILTTLLRDWHSSDYQTSSGVHPEKSEGDRWQDCTNTEGDGSQEKQHGTSPDGLPSEVNERKVNLQTLVRTFLMNVT